jgi:predicted nucleic acid-binding protein
MSFLLDTDICSAHLKLALVTHNTQDYANIPGLNLDDWLVP